MTRTQANITVYTKDIIKSCNAGFEIEFISYDQSEMSMNGIVIGKTDIILTVSGSKAKVLPPQLTALYTRFHTYR